MEHKVITIEDIIKIKINISDDINLVEIEIENLNNELEKQYVMKGKVSTLKYKEKDLYIEF